MIDSYILINFMLDFCDYLYWQVVFPDMRCRWFIPKRDDLHVITPVKQRLVTTVILSHSGWSGKLPPLRLRKWLELGMGSSPATPCYFSHSSPSTLCLFSPRPSLLNTTWSANAWLIFMGALSWVMCMRNLD